MARPIIRIKRSSTSGKKPEVNQLQVGELGLNTYDAELYTLRERVGFATDVVRLGAGATVTNILYVTQDGNDSNTGKKLGDAKRTIGAALTTATTGTVIKVSAGSYLENNPLIIPEQVSIVGDSLREVSVSPQNVDQDLFYVSNGNYIAEMSYTGTLNSGKAIFAFNPNQVGYFDQSPYIQNCTNFIPNSIGLKIDGSKAIGPLKSMVLDSYTQYNQGGIGCSITNEGYAQLVSLFTICNDIAVYCGSGGACDLTNSNSSFGNYGLISDDVSLLKYVGIVTQTSNENDDEVVIKFDFPQLNVIDAQYDNATGLTTITVDSNHNFNVGMGISISGLGFTCQYDNGETTLIYPSGSKGYVFEIVNIPSTDSFEVYVGVSTISHNYASGGIVSLNVVRPFDGQSVYFNSIYYTVKSIDILNPGSGYSDPPSIEIDSPNVPWGITAKAVAQIRNGSVENIELVSSGRGYENIPQISLGSPQSGINTATAIINFTPTYYNIVKSTPISSGIATITLNQNIPFSVGVGTGVYFFKQSRILASGHSMEYIGSGTNIAYALPKNGGIPIPDNETDSRNGGIVIFTVTDQSGNFKIGDGVIINQTTGTITGDFYSRSLFSTMTPYILALGGD